MPRFRILIPLGIGLLMALAAVPGGAAEGSAGVAANLTGPSGGSFRDPRAATVERRPDRSGGADGAGGAGRGGGRRTPDRFPAKSNSAGPISTKRHTHTGRRSP